LSGWKLSTPSSKLFLSISKTLITWSTLQCHLSTGVNWNSEIAKKVIHSKERH
jgi:hypothetical protein